LPSTLPAWDADQTKFEYGDEGKDCKFNGSLGKNNLIDVISGEGLQLKKGAGITGRGSTGIAGRSTAGSNQNAAHLYCRSVHGFRLQSSVELDHEQ
jgi:hypothetical protein